MKIIKIANSIAISIPILLLLIGFIDNEFFLYSALSVAITGALQTLIALAFWIKNTKNKLIPFYFLFSLVFFFIFFFLDDFKLDAVFSISFWILPILLSFYLSFIIYSTKEKLPENQ